MNTPTYCRTYGQRIGKCTCYRCRPAAKTKPASAPEEKKL